MISFLDEVRKSYSSLAHRPRYALAFYSVVSLIFAVTCTSLQNAGVSYNVLLISAAFLILPLNFLFYELVNLSFSERENAVAAPIGQPAEKSDKSSFGRLFWLSHELGLDVYGTSTLSYAARLDIEAAALVLSIVFLFDFASWSLLLYSFFGTGWREPGFPIVLWTVGGLLFALVLLLYQRAFLVADMKSFHKRGILLASLQLCMIVGAAFLTAQPIELLIFGRRIETRIQQEQVHQNILKYYLEARATTGRVSPEENVALRQWMHGLRDLPAGENLREEITLNGQKAVYEFKFVDYDFIGKLRVLDDLLQGRPALWPEATKTDLDALKATLDVYDVDGSARQPSLAAEIRNARRMYFSAFGLVIFIQLLPTLFKLVSRSLTAYYSVEWQAGQAYASRPSPLAANQPDSRLVSSG